MSKKYRITGTISQSRIAEIREHIQTLVPNIELRIEQKNVFSAIVDAYVSEQDVSLIKLCISGVRWNVAECDNWKFNLPPKFI